MAFFCNSNCEKVSPESSNITKSERLVTVSHVQWFPQLL